MNKWRLRWQKLIALAIAACFIIIIPGNIIARSQPASNSDLPSLQVHSLPKSLEQWQDQAHSGDYFNQVESTPLGYLVWSHFPVTVYIEQPLNINNNINNTAADRQFQQWVTAVKKAIAEWNVYLPLEEIANREIADIVILRSQPEIKIKLNPDTGLYDIPRAVTAETDYDFYLTENPVVIAHKMTVQVSPGYAGVALLATIRHELGHAIGIWGHSPEKSDALYFSQVSNPPTISPRDINTLKKIYQQPTRLGWKIKG